MGQSFTAGTIAAIIVIIVLAALVMIYVWTYPTKKNGGVRIELGKLNKPLKDGSTTRIMSLATGRYLRRRVGLSCSDTTIDQTPGQVGNYSLVTADATRAQATLWKMVQCTNCATTGLKSAGGTLPYSVSGLWCFYEAVSDTESHYLTFTDYNNGGFPIPPNVYYDRLFNGSRTLHSDKPVPYIRGTAFIPGPPIINATPPVNYLPSNFWFDLQALDPNLSSGPNGAFQINVIAKVGIPEQLTSYYSDGVYYNAAYDSNTHPPTAGAFTEQTCNELKSHIIGENINGLPYPDVQKTFFFEVL